MASTYRKKAIELAKQLVREAGDDCEWCGKTRPNVVLQGSHILSEGAYKNMAAQTENIIRLCYHCHFHKWHKNPLEASEWFEQKFPGRKDRLYQEARENPKRDWQAVYEGLRGNNGQ